jgi:hypothetical protein
VLLALKMLALGGQVPFSQQSEYQQEPMFTNAKNEDVSNIVE